MKIKRLFASVLAVAMLLSVCIFTTAVAAAETFTVANYYDTGDCRIQGIPAIHEGQYGWKGGVSTAPTAERVHLDLDVASNWAKVGAVKAKNLDFNVPALAASEGGNKLDENGYGVQDTENLYGMTYVGAKIVEGASKTADGNYYPANETPFITYEVKADAGNYITSIDVTSWGCVMYGGITLDFFVTPEIPGEVTDPALKDLTTYEYLTHFGTAYSAITNQNGNYLDSTAWKFNANQFITNPDLCGTTNVVYVTAMFNSFDTGAGTGMTGNTDVGHQIRFMGAKIVCGQAACAHATTEEVAEVAATCLRDGRTAGVVCADCGNIVSGCETIAMTEHVASETLDGVKEQDCATRGFTGDTVCASCDTILAKGTVIAAHFFDVTGAVEATCTTEGYTGNKVCTACAYSEQGTVIPATGEHTPADEKVGAVEPTFTEEGYTGDTVCKHCNTVIAYGTSIPVLSGGDAEKGDVNLDGAVNMSDYQQVCNAAAEFVVFDETKKAIADMNGDGKVNMADVQLLYNKISGNA